MSNLVKPIYLAIIIMLLLNFTFSYLLNVGNINPLSTPDAIRYFIEASGERAYERSGGFYFPITETYGAVLNFFFNLGFNTPELLLIANYIFIFLSIYFIYLVAELFKKPSVLISAMWLAISPSVTDLNVQLLKESFLILCLSASIYLFFIKKFFWLILLVLFSSLVRPYFAYYIFLFFIFFGICSFTKGLRLILYSNLIFGMFLLSIWPEIYVYSYAAFLFIPTIWSTDNLLSFSLPTIEFTLVTILFVIASISSVSRLKIFFFSTISIANLIFCISFWRLMFGEQTWEAGQVLVDNFYRKKLVLVYLVIYYLSFFLTDRGVSYNSTFNSRAQKIII